MIGEPVNDRACLEGITAVVAELAGRDDGALRELADRHGTTKALVAWIRSLPQRDDDGEPDDGPKVAACSPPQRLRIPAPDPNCVERAALFVAVAELIDPAPVRQLATVDTQMGPHTFPVEDGQPVVLDPKMSRNALRGGLYRNAPTPVELSPTEAIGWIVEIATEPAQAIRGGRALVRRAHEAMLALLDGQVLDDDDIADVALVLALAEREARAFGPAGLTTVLATAEVLADLDAEAYRNGRGRKGWRFGRWRVRPHPATVAVVKATERIGERAAAAAARAYLASLGVPPTLLEELERELRAEGFTLGAMGRAPRPGAETLATDAVEHLG
ncbi:MAG: hypothetical protein KC464_31785 [Myxococcales bacterium]|nr:hypothetical protein [Myxococcales bacterium]